MTDELTTLWMAMTYKFGFILFVSGWVTALRLALGWWSAVAQKIVERLIPDDRAWIYRTFDSRAYRIVGACLNVVASVKLPQVPRKVTGNTDFLLKAKAAKDERWTNIP